MQVKSNIQMRHVEKSTKSTVSLARQFNAGVYLKTEQCVRLKVASIFLPWTSLKKKQCQ